ncbi:MAG: tetraacyldisaccharide 4'-kinase [Candidatus Lightella neohaematopini]|nr:tetraacyldisaccharide 4'-kinase [Candidatus Lightella neohaematopini]
MRKCVIYNIINKILVKIWFSNSLLIYLLLPITWLYKLSIIIIKFFYKVGWLKTYYFSVPVIIIGNITVGGNGKTPIVIWLANKLKYRGWKVGIVIRGYGGNIKYPCIVTNNIDSKQCGDEAILIWQRTNVPVVVAKKRVLAVSKLIQLYNLDIIISDDGLQHYSLGRIMEWIVVNGYYRFGNGYLLPSGPMRENISRLNQSKVVIVNNGLLQRNEIPMFIKTHNIINLYNKTSISINRFKFNKVILIAGIGHPKVFFNMVRCIGILPVKEISFCDHQEYDQSMLDQLTYNKEQLLMTEKDAIRCQKFARENWWYLPIYAYLPSKISDKLLNDVEYHIFKYKTKII